MLVAMADFRIIAEAARVDPEWAVIEAIWEELDTPYEPDPRLSELTPGQRAIYALRWISSEVENGGFHQCFWNPTGSLLPEAIEGADVLGSPGWAQLLQEARDVLPAPYPRGHGHRRAALEQLSEEAVAGLEQLDDRLYDLDGAEETSLDSLSRRYIEAHPEDFFVPAAGEEEAAAALLACARQLVDEPPPRRLDLAASLLAEASRRSRGGGTGQVAELAESLLAQLPDLRS